MSLLPEVLRIYTRSKLWKRTMSDVVSLYLVSEINRMGLKKDDIFPLSSKKIKEALGVSLDAVNTAWKAIAGELGGVEQKPSAGTIITNPSALLIDEKSLEVYFKIRIQAETELARLATKRANEADCRAMAEAIEEQERAVNELRAIAANPSQAEEVEKGLLELFLSDLIFHRALRESAHDPWLWEISEISEVRFQPLRFKGLSNPTKDYTAFVDSHQGILDAIQARDEKKTIEAVEAHFELAKRELFSQTG